MPYLALFKTLKCSQLHCTLGYDTAFHQGHQKCTKEDFFCYVLLLFIDKEIKHMHLLKTTSTSQWLWHFWQREIKKKKNFCRMMNKEAHIIASLKGGWLTFLILFCVTLWVMLCGNILKKKWDVKVTSILHWMEHLFKECCMKQFQSEVIKNFLFFSFFTNDMQSHKICRAE